MEYHRLSRSPHSSLYACMAFFFPVVSSLISAYRPVLSRSGLPVFTRGICCNNGLARPGNKYDDS